MTRTTWGELCSLEYGKALRDYLPEQTESACFRVYGTNGPIGWSPRKLRDDAGIVVGRKGAYRGIHYSPDPFFVIDTAYYLKPRSQNLHLKWAYYKLLTVDLDQVDVGAAIPTTNREAFYSLPVSIPEPHIQHDIARVLSAYDDLIENNRRRMALLEESARLLYQEWFVRLRFPGHEHARIVNGVPEGWSKSNLESACLPKHGIQTGPFGSQLHQSDYSDDGTPVVMPKDIIGSRISTESIARVPEEICERLSRHILQAGDIVLARRGDIGRKAFVTEREAGWMCGTGCMRLRPDSTAVYPRYLLHTLGRPDVMGIIAGRAQGAIMPNLNLSILADVPLVLPPATLQREFDELVAIVERQLTNLGEQSSKLCTARDVLLPRLMSGEVSV